MDNATIDAWKLRDFGGCTRDELREACKFLEIEISPATGLDTLRRKLQEHYGTFEKAASAAPAPRKTGRRPPNLRSVLNWEGKRYRIKAMATQENGERAYPVAWESEVFWIDPKAAYQDVPAPIFHSLNDAEGMTLSLKWKQERMETERTITKFKRFPFSLMGVTPGTENLPESLRQWYQRDCEAHDRYETEHRDNLERVWFNLTDGSHPNKEDKDRNTEFWRAEIRTLLGLSTEQIEDRDLMEEAA